MGSPLELIDLLHRHNKFRDNAAVDIGHASYPVVLCRSVYSLAQRNEPTARSRIAAVNGNFWPISKNFSGRSHAGRHGFRLMNWAQYHD